MKNEAGEIIDLGDLCGGNGYSLPAERTPLGPENLPPRNNPYRSNSATSQTKSEDCSALLGLIDRQEAASRQLNLENDPQGLQTLVNFITRSGQEIGGLSLSDPQLVEWQQQLVLGSQLASGLLQGFDQLMEQLAQGFAESFGVENPGTLQGGNSQVSFEQAQSQDPADSQLIKDIQAYCAVP
jgi:hypothetical protein